MDLKCYIRVRSCLFGFIFSFLRLFRQSCANIGFVAFVRKAISVNFFMNMILARCQNVSSSQNTVGFAKFNSCFIIYGLL